MKQTCEEKLTSLDLIRKIIVNQMDMPEERVNIYDEKWKIPTDEELFITIEYRNSTCIANNNYFKNEEGYETPLEYQEVNMLEKIVVGVFSRDQSAIQRKEEVLMAIMSSYSQFIQEQYSFKIARAAHPQDLSALEGVAMLKRYDIELSVYTWYQKIVKPQWIVPPYTIKVVANAGSGNIERDVTQITQLPN